MSALMVAPASRGGSFEHVGARRGHTPFFRLDASDLGLTNIFRNLIQNKVVGEKSAFFKILIKIKYISIKTLIEIKCISTE